MYNTEQGKGEVIKITDGCIILTIKEIMTVSSADLFVVMTLESMMTFGSAVHVVEVKLSENDRSAYIWLDFSVICMDNLHNNNGPL